MRLRFLKITNNIASPMTIIARNNIAAKAGLLLASASNCFRV
jgi:uncharacterized protein YueI